MNIGSKIRKLNTNSTVFSTADIKKALNIKNDKSLYNAISYAINTQELYKISDGIYSFDNNYSKKEFANKFRSPSYISLYTVLQETGVIFQPYTSIYVISNRSEEVTVENQKYIYRKIKDNILLNPFGIIQNENISIATKERAICDILYLDGEQFFDNVRNVNWNLISDLNKDVYENNQDITNFINRYKK
jgi:hypothetical protein